MNKVKVLAISQEKILVLAQFAILMSVAVAAPLLQQQAITGVLVNAALFISVMLLGLQGAILIALIPSLIALSIGLLPSILAPMIPFIMAGNVVLILVFNHLKEKSYWLGVVSASILKFLFLFGASSVVINLIVKKEIAVKAAAMMSWPQLFTALAGGLIAYLFFNKGRLEIKK